MENINTILFDLDGTLLETKAEEFERVYLGSLAHFVSDEIDPKDFGKLLWTAVGAMVKDNSDILNKDIFYQEFHELLGDELFNRLEPRFDEYYEKHFDVVKDVMHRNEIMVEVVNYFKDKGYKVLLATNPMLPWLATDKRIAWAGFSPDDFSDITRFETDRYCKPNPKYYEDLCQRNDLDPTQCLMIGNDIEEDGVAKTVGMKVWIVDDNLIHRGSPITCDWIGSREELLEKVKAIF